jgi:hypothetical protein
MDNTEFLNGYSGQTLEELLAMETSHRIDSLVMAMELALDQKLEARGADSLSSPERVILAVEALEREVNNGGYHQFFCNSSRLYAGEIEAALRGIGCPKHADIARRAIATLKVDGPLTPDAIEAALDVEEHDVEAALSSLDQEYYSCEEPIVDQLFAFVKARRAEIRLR